MAYDGRMNLSQAKIRTGMVGLGMIFEETYRPLFETLFHAPLFRPDFGIVDVELSAVASKTGSRAAKYQHELKNRVFPFQSFSGERAIHDLLESNIDAICIATPDDRHFFPAQLALRAGKHVLIEKPSVLTLRELDTLTSLAQSKKVLAKVVYHKLADPDHKKLRTHYLENNLQHINNGYCSLLEPKSISGGQFAEWVSGRNPGTYVAVHYLKLVDFTFGPNWKLTRISATGQRGLVGSPKSNTWDSVQLQVIYTHPDHREAAFDIHTSWVTPDNFPGYVDQEVQFRFDNGVWNAHQRKRGVEITVENKTPSELKYTPNHHYNGTFIEPWGERSQRGYGIEILRRFFDEVAYVEFGGSKETRNERLQEMRALYYNDLSADRNCVAIVQSMEAILARHAEGNPGSLVEVNGPEGGLVLYPRQGKPEILYPNQV
jgi:D-galacturonate reductase